MAIKKGALRSLCFLMINIFGVLMPAIAELYSKQIKLNLSAMTINQITKLNVIEFPRLDIKWK